MKHARLFWITTLCTIACLFCAARWLHTKPIYAQQNETEYDDGTFYISAYVNVDSSYNLSLESYMEVEFDYYEDIDAIEVDAYADEDSDIYYSTYQDGDDYDPADIPLGSNSPVAPGHEYGLKSDGYACFDDGEGNCDFLSFESIANVYTSVNVVAPTPQITSINPTSAKQGDQGTLTITGTNLVQGSGDQLTLNFSGGNSPFTPSGTPSATSASFSYNFSGYPSGSYTLSVTNNEGTSNSESFTVNSSSSGPSGGGTPPDPCNDTANPKVQFSSIVSTGTTGGSGTMTVSFSGTAYAAISPTVTYGPRSTPSSIAASIAALITKNYFRYGLSAKAFGPNVIYNGNKALGTVSNITTGPSFTTNTSSTAADGAEAACDSNNNTNGNSVYYQVVYKASIPVDNLPGPTPCTVGPYYVPTTKGLDYIGDTSSFSATKYRVQEIAYPSTNPSIENLEIPPLPFPGKTVNFATTNYTLGGGSPLPTITLGQFLEPNPLDTTVQPGTRSNPTYPWEWQCNPPKENAFGYTDLSNVDGTSSSTSTNSVVTEFTGLASDPLEPPVGGINWDLTVSINSSNNTATISGWNTCYPAHQIQVNGVLIYDSEPTQNNTTYLAACLTGANLGSSNPTIRRISNCTVSLNNAQPCVPQ